MAKQIKIHTTVQFDSNQTSLSKIILLLRDMSLRRRMIFFAADVHSLSYDNIMTLIVLRYDF